MVFWSQPRQRLQGFLSQAPDLMRNQIYPAEALSFMGSKDSVRQVTSESEPWCGRGVYTGRKLTLQDSREISTQEAGLSLEGLPFWEMMSEVVQAQDRNPRRGLKWFMEA